MEFERFQRDTASRRRFFQLAGVSLAGGGATFLAACGSNGGAVGTHYLSQNGPSGSPNPAARVNDANVLNSALDLEHMAIAAYTAGLPLLKGGVRRAALLFRSQEQEHAQALNRAIRNLGGTPNKPQSSYDFPRLRNQRDVLRFAESIEHTAVAAYIDAIPKLNEPALRSTGAAITTDEAEHIAVLNEALGQQAAPDAFVTGTGGS